LASTVEPVWSLAATSTCSRPGGRRRPGAGERAVGRDRQRHAVDRAVGGGDEGLGLDEAGGDPAGQRRLAVDRERARHRRELDERRLEHDDDRGAIAAGRGADAEAALGLVVEDLGEARAQVLDDQRRLIDRAPTTSMLGDGSMMPRCHSANSTSG
jgi:hypothetical protein